MNREEERKRSSQDKRKRKIDVKEERKGKQRPTGISEVNSKSKIVQNLAKVS